jgi:hypothetical protein
MRLSLDRLWVLLAIGLPALAALIVPLPAVDLAYGVRTGELILVAASLPSVDTYTFTVAGEPWTDQQWLAQVAFALVHRAGGWELLAVLRAAMVAATFGLVIAASIVRGAAPRTASILALLAFLVAAPALALRPQLIGILLFAVLVWLVADRRRRPGRMWLAPVLIVLWANVHGSVVLAPILLGYAWLEDLVDRSGGANHRQSLAVLILGSLATLVNPFGIGVWGYALGVGLDPEITGQVAEWQRTSPFTVPGLLFYLSAATVAVLLVIRRGTLRWPAWLWLATLFVVGAWTVRGLPWWALGAAVTVAAVLPAAAAARRPRANALNAVTAIAIGVAIVAALPWWRPVEPLTGRVGLLSYAPSGLAQALQDQVVPEDRVFTPQTLGSWFEWAVPDARYFVDSRIELFPAEVWRDYRAIVAGDGALDLLAEWKVQAVVVSPDEPGLREALDGSEAWVRLHADDDGELYLRIGSASPVARTVSEP